MKIIQQKHCDIFVAGGGVAGAAAALQAARMGKHVILAEKAVQLGGLATAGLVNLFEPMCNGRGVQIIKGMADEFQRLSIRYSYDDLKDDWVNGEPGFGKTNKRLCSHFSAPIFALALCELLSDAGVELMFDTVVTEVEHQNGKIEAVQVFNKSGYSRITASMFVDTTGDSDLLNNLGVPTVKQGNYHTYAGMSLSLETCQKAIEAQDVAKLYYDTPGGKAGRTGKNHPEGMPLWDGTDGEQVSRYFTQNQRELLARIKNDDRRSRDIVMLPAMHQFRTTRRLDGNATLLEEDVYRHRSDSIGAISDLARRDCIYEVPYGTLVKDGFPNIITAGRSASAAGHGWEVLRIIPSAILTGQVAGMSCAMAIDAGCAITDISVPQLQEKLEQSGVMIHFNDEWIPKE